ncbi:MAG: electron transport complex subunit E [bacterium]|nr:electron transport complex subunit E [bacterium]MDT8364897.1 electron transport complex subunit E [bacterium]
MSGYIQEFTKGIWKDNPVFKMVLGLCPLLAVTSTAINGIAMGLASTFVLVCSNTVVSSLRSIIPSKVRIPAFIIVIASFVTIVDLSMNAWAHQLHKTLGLFIPLIVVNCLILGRSEAFASRNPVLRSMVDGIGMGLGFTLALFLLGTVREILGSGTFFGYPILGSGYNDILVLILPPGAFLAMGIMLGAFNSLERS